MPEEIKNQTEQKNTVATVGMWFSISGLVAGILIIFGFLCLFNENLAILGILMLFIGSILGLFSLGILNFLVGFILGIVGLFYKPKYKARIAILIPILFVVIPTITICNYLWSSAKTPAIEFGEWANETLTEERFENIDEDKFEKLVEYEANKLIKEKDEEQWKAVYEATTGTNAVEKISYIFFGVLRQSIENALNSYDTLPNEIIDNEIENEDNENIITIDIEKGEIETSDTEAEKETVEVFSESEKNDIEQIIDLLE